MIMHRAYFAATTVNFRQFLKKTMSSLVATSERIAVVNYTPEKDRMELSFKYGTDGVSERQFNFNRSSCEELGSALTRIATNISGQLDKRSKRKRSKKQADSEQETPTQTAVNVTLKYQNKCVELNASNRDAWKEGSILEIGGKEYIITVNAPTVRSVRLPKVIMAGFPVYPNVELEHANLRDCAMEWYKTNIKGQNPPASETRKVNNMLFVKAHEHGLSIIPSNTDIGRHLLLVLTPCNGSRQGIPVEVVSSTSVEAGPGPCPFETRHVFTADFTNSGRFRCISYNILADTYADQKYTKAVLFPYCPPYALELAYRKLLLIKEIQGYKGDLICLQEVDRKVYLYDLEPPFSTSGLSGFYTEKGGNMAEGLACFYRTSKFRCLDNQSIILSKALAEVSYLADILYSISRNPQLQERMLTRPTALQVVLLECLERKDRLLLVANTHLYFHPDSDHIRLLQAYCCIRILHWLRAEYTERYGSPPAVLLSGDFNSTPEFGVYKLMTTGQVPESCADWKSNAEEAVHDLAAVQGIPMDSACGTPEYTNYTTGFQGCLDYIFIERNRLVVEEVVPMPSHHEVTCHQAIPSIVFPSDHIALVATLKWI